MNNGNASGHSLHTHYWSNDDPPHQITQDGRTILHHRCSHCGRDFGLELDGTGWHALYIGLVRVELLAESVNQRWLVEKCPGLPLWDRDREDRATRQTSSQTRTDLTVSKARPFRQWAAAFDRQR
jgi:hypothetical protein